MSPQRYLFAVEPDRSMVIAKWPLGLEASEEEIADLQSRYQKLVGESYVILRSDDHPRWYEAVCSAGGGISLQSYKARKSGPLTSFYRKWFR